MTSQYGAYALRVGLAGLHARMRMHTPKRPGTHMHARRGTHIQSNRYHLFLFHSNNNSLERHSVTLYVHCLSCVPVPSFKRSVYFSHLFSIHTIYLQRPLARAETWILTLGCDSHLFLLLLLNTYFKARFTCVFSSAKHVFLYVLAQIEENLQKLESAFRILATNQAGRLNCAVIPKMEKCPAFMWASSPFNLLNAHLTEFFWVDI